MREVLADLNIDRAEDVATLQGKCQILLSIDGYEETFYNQNIYLTNNLQKWSKLRMVIFAREELIKKVPNARRLFSPDGLPDDEKLLDCSF
jgi:hypothetical protein